MSRSKNAVKFSDVSTAPVKLKYSASYSDSDFSSVGISIVRGINIPVTSSVKVPQFKINYNLLEQLYYRSYISGSLFFSASAYDSSYQSTAASGTFDEDVRYFPTQSGAEIVALYIPRNIFGEQIARKSFVLTTPRYNIYDDGNGNLLDSFAGNVKVGNIIYSQAFIVITNENYRCYFIDTDTFDFSVKQDSNPIVPTPTPSVTPSLTPSVSVTPSFTPSVTITPSTSRPPVYEYLINYWTYQIISGVLRWEGKTNSTDACTLGGTIRLISVYSNSSTFQNGIKLWTNSSLTNAFETVSGIAYFKNYTTNESFKYDSSAANVIEELQSCVASTPSPTPSITVSVTPTVTPSITLSITPTVTP